MTVGQVNQECAERVNREKEEGTEKLKDQSKRSNV